MKSKLVKLVNKFANLGLTNTSSGAVLIGKATHVAPDAWLNILYPCLVEDELAQIEESLQTKIPIEFRTFLKEVSNGLTIMVRVFSIYGLRVNNDRTNNNIRQPFSIEIPNIYERPDNAKENHFFIGGYSWDGSKLYIDKNTNKVHYCDRWDVTSLYEWNSFEEMLISEITRIYTLYDCNGVKIIEDMWTTPIER